MLKINIRRQGKTIDEIIADVKNVELGIRNQVDKLASDTVSKMRAEITPRRSGSTGNLAKSIDKEVYVNNKNNFRIGIGNIDILNTVAKYWYVLSFGTTYDGRKFIPPANVGSFQGSPSDPVQGLQGNGTQKWNHGDGSFMTPKTFRPIPYIQNTTAWLASVFKRAIKIK